MNRLGFILLFLIAPLSSSFAQVVDTLSIDEIVITGTRSEKRLSESPVLTTVVRDSDITKAGNVSLTEVLEDNIPGLLIVDAGAMGTDIYMKGLTTQYVLILVDGERLASNGRNGNVNLDQIDTNNILRVEYINGAATSLYGSNAMGGVINIITKNATKKISTGASYDYSSSMKNKYKAHLSSRLDKFSIYGSGSLGNQQYYVPDNGSVIEEYDEYSADLKAEYRPSQRLTLSAIGRFYGVETFNVPSSIEVSHSLEYSYTANGMMSYKSKNFKNLLSLSANYNTSRQYDIMELSNNDKQPNDFNGYLSTKVIDSYSFNSNLDMMLGGEFNQETASSADKLSDDGAANKSNYDINLFTQVDWDITQKCNAILGARYTQNEMFGASFDPKLSIMYKIPRFTFRFGVGTAYKAPSLRELYYDYEHTGSGLAVFHISGNPDLKAEKGFFGSLSAEYTHKSLNISTSLYYNNIRNKINMVEVYDSEDSSALPDIIYENVGRAIIEGLDISARYNLLKQIVFAANYTLCYSIDNETGLQISGTSLHYCTLSTTWNGKILNSPFSLQFAGRLSSPRYSYDDDMNQVATDAFSIWKVAFVKPFTINRHKFEATLKVDNLFDFTHDYYTTIGRQYLFGVRYNFN